MAIYVLNLIHVTLLLVPEDLPEDHSVVQYSLALI